MKAESRRYAPEIPKTPESLSPAVTQAVTVKAFNSPELLGRSLSAMRESLSRSTTSSVVTFGVLDDSPDPEVRKENKRVLAESGINGFYLSTKETGEGSPLRRIYERAKEMARRRGVPESNIVNSYQYLLTEQTDIDHPTSLPNMNVGGGNCATSNVATLLSSYLLGLSKTPYENGVITHYDHDVIPGLSLATDSTGKPTFSPFDTFREREDFFEEKERLVSTGKYAGIAGDPFGTAEIALRVTEGILNDIDTGNADEISPYAIYDSETHIFTQITKGEAYQRLPEIIRSFLARAPITGFLTNDGPELTAFTPSNIKFDGGNITTRDTLARTVPIPPTGVHEYGVLALLKALNTDVSDERLIGVETPSMHLRADHEAADPHGGGLLSGTTGRIIQHQILAESALAKRPALAGEIFNTVNHSGAQQPDQLSDYLPKLNTNDNPNKKERFIRVKAQRDRIRARRNNLSANEGEELLINSIDALLSEFDDTTLDNMVEVLDPSSQNSKDVRKMGIAIQRQFIPAVRAWPYLYDAAYQIGLEDAT